MTFYEQQLKRFESLIERDVYQQTFLENPIYLYPTLPVGLFISPGGGKLNIGIQHFDHFYSFSKNKNLTSVFIPASTKELRSNGIERFDAFNNVSPLNFTYRAVSTRDELYQAIKDKVQVIIALPILLKNHIDAFKNANIGWFVLDEAHEWYFEKTITYILKKLKPKYQMLMTGTPFMFNREKSKYLGYYVSTSQLREANRLHNYRVEIVTSTYDRRLSDYRSAYGNLRMDTEYSIDSDKQALLEVCREMIKKLKLPQYANDFNVVNRITKNALSVFGVLDKTIIYCDRVDQANNMYSILDSFDGLKGHVAVSTSEDDVDAEMIHKFKHDTEADIRVLILCDRARKGFDMPELFNIVDFTMTFNVYVQVQMKPRIGRKSKLQPDKQKIFFKVASVNNADWVKAFMTSCLALVEPEYYENFTGDMGKLPVPVVKQPSDRRVNKRRKTGERGINITPAHLRYDLPLSCDFWKDFHHKQNDVYATMAVTTLDDVRKYFYDVKDKVPRTPERVWESVTEALEEGKTFQQWAFVESNEVGKRGRKKLDRTNQSYNMAYKLGIIDDVMRAFGYPASEIDVNKLTDIQLIEMFNEKKILPETANWMHTKKWDQNAAQADIWALYYEIRSRRLQDHKLLKQNLLKRGTQEHNIILQYRYDEKSGKAIYEAKYDNLSEAAIAQGLSANRSPIINGNIAKHDLKKGIYAINRQGKIFIRKNGTILKSFEAKIKQRKPRSDKGQWGKHEWQRKRDKKLTLKIAAKRK